MVLSGGGTDEDADIPLSVGVEGSTSHRFVPRQVIRMVTITRWAAPPLRENAEGPEANLGAFG
ncbi:MAG TPA: hypothetical protein IAA98_01150 [Candidatus Avipropionibacterium avicola]|uniref:Uncharacterized protein n=1 Tax=Candidatus Avipropionibacterium avicola TaxID=2840701 RepID=A0A9D1KL89_9ACTN|nr:hypothetical protein [Candidatus Avipropionibacterium avicola]